MNMSEDAERSRPYSEDIDWSKPYRERTIGDRIMCLHYLRGVSADPGVARPILMKAGELMLADDALKRNEELRVSTTRFLGHMFDKIDLADSFGNTTAQCSEHRKGTM
jgi:hypothetical protein